MKRLVIVGAGAFGREVLAWARADAAHGRDWTIAGFLDDRQDALGDRDVGVRVLGPATGHRPDPETLYVGAIGQMAAKRKVVGELAARGARFARIVHPTVVLGERVVLGEGVILCPRVTITCDVVVGDFVSANVGCAITHDVRLGAFTQLSDFVDLCGGVVLGAGVFAGSGARVLPGVRVGDGATLGAGAVVMRDVAPGVTVAGNPARPLPAVPG